MKHDWSSGFDLDGKTGGPVTCLVCSAPRREKNDLDPGNLDETCPLRRDGGSLPARPFPGSYLDAPEFYERVKAIREEHHNGAKS